MAPHCSTCTWGGAGCRNFNQEKSAAPRKEMSRPHTACGEALNPENNRAVTRVEATSFTTPTTDATSGELYAAHRFWEPWTCLLR